MSRKTRGQVHGHTHEAHIRPKRLAQDANGWAEQLRRDAKRPVLKAPVTVGGKEKS